MCCVLAFQWACRKLPKKWLHTRIFKLQKASKPKLMLSQENSQPKSDQHLRLSSKKYRKNKGTLSTLTEDLKSTKKVCNKHLNKQVQKLDAHSKSATKRRSQDEEKATEPKSMLSQEDSQLKSDQHVRLFSKKYRKIELTSHTPHKTKSSQHRSSSSKYKTKANDSKCSCTMDHELKVSSERKSHSRPRKAQDVPWDRDMRNKITTPDKMHQNLC